MVQLSDRKMRFAGLLENPYLSMMQRNILDYGRWQALKPLTFDMVMLLDTAHHLTDEQFLSVLGEMAAASRSWILVSDQCCSIP